jgi:hypothetical protein
MVEHLPSTGETQNSILSTKKKKRGGEGEEKTRMKKKKGKMFLE